MDAGLPEVLARRDGTARGAYRPASLRINRPASLTLFALAALVVAFIAVWVTIPAGRYESKNLTTGQWETSQVGHPARLLRHGLRSRDVSCVSPSARNPDVCVGAARIVRLRTDLDALRSRTLVVFGALAAVIVLVGVAAGALRGY